MHNFLKLRSLESEFHIVIIIAFGHNDIFNGLITLIENNVANFVMRTFSSLLPAIVLGTFLSGCVAKRPQPQDPYESINRKTYQFNQFFDTLLLKPAAKAYKAILPAPVRVGINNVYDNVNMVPTVANDLLQADIAHAIKDFWRLGINTSLGIGGILDVANARCGLPPRSNDLGLTLAKWGDTKSPYIVIPLLGPSTIRDGMAAMFQYAVLTPYPYIPSDAAIWGVLGFRYVDLRSQLLDSEGLIDEALDRYSFIRDAYLQHRNYKIQEITGEKNQNNTSNAEIGSDYITEDAVQEAGKKSS